MVVQDLSRFKRRPFRFKRNLHRMVGSRSLKVPSWFASSDLNVVSLGVSRFVFACISLHAKLHLGSSKVHEFSNFFHPKTQFWSPDHPKWNTTMFTGSICNITTKTTQKTWNQQHNSQHSATFHNFLTLTQEQQIQFNSAILYILLIES